MSHAVNECVGDEYTLILLRTKCIAYRARIYTNTNRKRAHRYLIISKLLERETK